MKYIVNPDSKRLFYTKRTFCESAGISAATFYRWTKLPGFPVVRCGRKILIPAEAAEAWIEKQIGKNIMPGGVNRGRTV